MLVHTATKSSITQIVTNYCSATTSCSDSVLRGSSTDFKKMGQRIFVFMIGGATRSEVEFAMNLSLSF